MPGDVTLNGDVRCSAGPRRATCGTLHVPVAVTACTGRRPAVAGAAALIHPDRLTMTHRHGEARRSVRSPGTELVTARWSPHDGAVLPAVRWLAVIRVLFLAVALVTHETVEIGSLEPSRVRE